MLSIFYIRGICEFQNIELNYSKIVYYVKLFLNIYTLVNDELIKAGYGIDIVKIKNLNVVQF